MAGDLPIGIVDQFVNMTWPAQKADKPWRLGEKPT